MNLDEYKYLWESEKDSWVLVNSPYGYGVINKRTQSMLLVSDESLENAIIDKMLAAGNKTYDDIESAYADT